jgi:hypothetical protein
MSGAALPALAPSEGEERLSRFEACIVGPLETGGSSREPQYRAERALVEYAVEEDLDELLLQQAYVTLFVIALPIAPLLLLVNHWFEPKIDASKLLFHARRPYPDPAQGIGGFLAMFQVLGFCATVVNAALVCFTPGVWTFGIDDDDVIGQAIAFAFIILIVLLAQYVTTSCIPDDPPAVVVQQARGVYLEAKHITLQLSADETKAAVRARRIPATLGMARPDSRPPPSSHSTTTSAAARRQSFFTSFG